MWDSGPVTVDRQAFVAYGGPPLSAGSRYHWTVSTADAGGTWSEPSARAAFITGLRTADWEALWLRPGPAEVGEEAYTYLRTTEALPKGTVDYATAYVAGAHKYQLWVNGSRVDTGPSFCFPDEQYYQASDVTSSLVPGRTNAVGILHHWYGPGRGRPTSAPGLLVQVVVHYVDGSVVTFASDDSWRARPAEWLPAPHATTTAVTSSSGSMAGCLPLGGRTPVTTIEPGRRLRCIGPVGTAPFTGLFAQRTRITEQALPASSVRTLPTGSVVVDFGKVYAGRPTVAFRSGNRRSPGAHACRLLPRPRRLGLHHPQHPGDRSVLHLHPAIRYPDFRALFVPGFRYLQIDEPGETIEASQVALSARHATMPDVTPATFASSDPMLDAVWALCAHSGLYTSQEQFIDTPTREKGQFLWDAANESQTVMRTYGEQNLSWQGLRDMARAQKRYWPHRPGQRGLPQRRRAAGLSVASPPGIRNGSGATTCRPVTVPPLALCSRPLARLSDYLVGIVDTSTGLISGQPLSTNGDNQYGYDYETNADTTLNIEAVNAFSRIGDIATLAGRHRHGIDPGPAGHRTGHRGQRPSGRQRRPLRGRPPNGRHPEHPHVPAGQRRGPGLRGGPGRRSRRRWPSDVASLDISVKPDRGLELLRALHAGGRDADVVRLLTDPSFPGWAAIIKAGGTFTWETWTPSDLIGDSMSHGWGSSALVAIQEVLLGAVPTAPRRTGRPPWSPSPLHPAASALPRGSFPTPAGKFTVDWRTSSAGRQLSVTVPPNAPAHAVHRGRRLPRSPRAGSRWPHPADVTVVGTRGGTVILAVGRVSYHFAVPDRLSRPRRRPVSCPPAAPCTTSAWRRRRPAAPGGEGQPGRIEQPGLDPRRPLLCSIPTDMAPAAVYMSSGTTGLTTQRGGGDRRHQPDGVHVAVGDVEIARRVHGNGGGEVDLADLPDAPQPVDQVGPVGALAGHRAQIVGGDGHAEEGSRARGQHPDGPVALIGHQDITTGVHGQRPRVPELGRNAGPPSPPTRRSRSRPPCRCSPGSPASRTGFRQWPRPPGGDSWRCRR